MKKIIKIFLIIILLFSIISFFSKFDSDNSIDDNSTDEEKIVLNYEKIIF